MRQIPSDIQSLIDKYLAGTATPEELRQLNEWYHSFDDATVTVTAGSATEEQVEERLKGRLLHTIGGARPAVLRKHYLWRLSAAAAAILMLVGSYYFLARPNKQVAGTTLPRSVDKEAPGNILPGGNKAVLTLADGSHIVLDTAADGTLRALAGVNIQKQEDGLLVYMVNGKRVTEKDQAFFNTITTPRGGQYQVTLSDGTKVWLNAASSIRFPVVFTGTERRIVITGEAYLEVAKNKAMPFRVDAAGTEVEVLGTHFNVNAYADEPSVETSLLEGRVRVSVPSSQSSTVIQPGERASVSKTGAIDVATPADVQEAVAWKNGRFQFKSTDLHSLLRQVARWYDVDVIYNGNVNLHFTGQLSRAESVTAIFKKLELTGEVHFKINGKTIIVSP